MMTSISGLRMNYHECNTSGNQSFILSLPLVAGEFSEEDFDCQCSRQTKELQTCATGCQMVEKHKPLEADCCFSGENFFVIDLEYLTGNTQKVESPRILNLLATNESVIHNLDDDTKDTTYTPIFSPPSAENYGKQILISYNQLKIHSA